MKIQLKLALLAATTILATPALALNGFDVRYESEAPGLQHSTATFSTVGVETFESIPTNYSASFGTDFGTAGAITGQYSNVQINHQDQYGAAGGIGHYAVAFASNPYSLDLGTSLPGGVNYFGYWLSALDGGNTVTFYSGATKRFTFMASDVLNVVNARPNPSQYYGNPNPAFAGQNGGEPYLFINFFADSGSFDRIEFSEPNAGGGYESDNHTVGRFLTKGTGSSVPLSGAVPEPASWAMLIAGFGLVGANMRISARRRRPVSVSA